MKNYELDVNGVKLDCQAESIDEAKVYFSNSGYTGVNTDEIVELGEVEEDEELGS